MLHNLNFIIIAVFWTYPDIVVRVFSPHTAPHIRTGVMRSELDSSDDSATSLHDIKKLSRTGSCQMLETTRIRNFQNCLRTKTITGGLQIQNSLL